MFHFRSCLLLNSATHDYFKNTGVIKREVPAPTNAVWAEPCVNKSPPEDLEYRPEFSGDVLKKSQNSRKFNLITSCLQETLDQRMFLGNLPLPKPNINT